MNAGKPVFGHSSSPSAQPSHRSFLLDGRTAAPSSFSFPSSSSSSSSAGPAFRVPNTLFKVACTPVVEEHDTQPESKPDERLLFDKHQASRTVGAEKAAGGGALLGVGIAVGDFTFHNALPTSSSSTTTSTSVTRAHAYTHSYDQAHAAAPSIGATSFFHSASPPPSPENAKADLVAPAEYQPRDSVISPPTTTALRGPPLLIPSVPPPPPPEPIQSRSRRASIVTVSADREYKLKRSISASITATLASPLRPLGPTADPYSRCLTPNENSSQYSSTIPDISTGRKTSYFMLSAHDRRRVTDPSKSNRPPDPRHRSTDPRRQNTDPRRQTSDPKSSTNDGQSSDVSPRALQAHISETTNKRIATLEYMRKVYEGDVFYFNTLSHTQSQLTTLPSLSAGRVGRRATNYLLLGTSIPPLFELHRHSPVEYLRALTGAINEYETYCTLSSETSASSMRAGRVGQIFKSGMRNVKSRRTSSAADSMMSTDSLSANGSSMNLANGGTSLVSPLEGLPSPPPIPITTNHEFHFLQTPSLPFEPDFGTSFATLIDVLTSTYRDLLSLLPTPETCTAPVGEAYAKADKALRKVLLASMASEMAENARKEARTEIGGLGKMVLSGLV